MSSAVLTRQSQVRTATILAGASLSDAIDLRKHVMLGLLMPDAWTTAAITFMGSDSATGTYVDLYDDAGAEITIAAGNVAASRGIGMDSWGAALAAWPWVKIRSGVTAAAVNQVAEAVIKVTAKA